MQLPRHPQPPLNDSRLRVDTADISDAARQAATGYSATVTFKGGTIEPSDPAIAAIAAVRPDFRIQPKSAAYMDAAIRVDRIDVGNLGNDDALRRYQQFTSMLFRNRAVMALKEENDAAESDAPLVAGGQGRTAKDVAKSADAFTLTCFILLIIYGVVSLVDDLWRMLGGAA